MLGRQRGPARPRGPLASAAMLLLAAAGLLAISRYYPAEVADVRARLAGPLDQVTSLVRAPLDPLRALAGRLGDQWDMEGELNRLRAENEELKGWQWRAQELERQLADLSRLTRVVAEPGLRFVTCRVRVRGLRPFSQSVLVNAGAREGIVTGMPVVNGAGLLGAVYEVGHVASRVRFLNDAASRVTVRIGRGGALAVAAGRSSPVLEITELERRFDIAAGDEVLTAGEEGGVPEGLKVGTVVKTSRGLAIRPAADPDRAEFVSVLLQKAPLQPGQSTAAAADFAEPSDHLGQSAPDLLPARDPPVLREER
ncbi:MAG: rod shape-determining protein MreC [Hyphomicrobiaceae bacterium]|nr:rod shape-determining protein MreC [Hyphomicrobiaceae bacterium]